MRLQEAGPSTAITLPLMHKDVELQSKFRCADGHLTAGDVGRAAGVSAKAARRAIDTYCAAHEDGQAQEGGAMLTFDTADFPAPQTQTRKQMAALVAKRIGLGRYGIQQRAAERAAARPPAKPKENRVSTQQHPWKDGKHGRSVKGQQGGAMLATLTCSRCPESLSIRFRQLCGTADMDAKFKQQGWAVDPAKCPTHNRRNHQPKEKTPMATAAPATTASHSPAAIAAQAKMFGLLQAHFDADTGVYGSGYSDQRIADECKLAVQLVAGVRREAFGDLKVPAEVAQLQADIGALEALLRETIAPIESELQALRRRVTECCKKFGG